MPVPLATLQHFKEEYPLLLKINFVDYWNSQKLANYLSDEGAIIEANVVERILKKYVLDTRRGILGLVHYTRAMPTEIMNYFKSHDELELRSKILSLCGDVLGGKWMDLHPNHATITSMRGGLTNLVYLIKRPKFSPLDDKPVTVLLRIQSQTDHEKLLNELVVYTSLAENGLGPKLLGVFPGGRFEEFIPSRPLEHDEVAHPRICSLLARILPRFHSTAVPISKRPNILKLMREWLALFEEQGNSHVQLQSTSFHLHLSDFPSTISTNDLAKEIDIIEEFLGTSPSPVVFCHNDLTNDVRSAIARDALCGTYWVARCFDATHSTPPPPQ
ncbi:unnamed protein product [Angiostrongylus costaricensis]|uniref:Choline/ethanolamine kinase n=1 Tax=Angiostrongylus costaricensis TaxID=334426 RepID=A0A158PEY0_ANGCS|nr:unnamed protein product [Angiostrongylus costaricensis]